MGTRRKEIRVVIACADPRKAQRGNETRHAEKLSSLSSAVCFQRRDETAKVTESRGCERIGPTKVLNGQSCAEVGQPATKSKK